MALTNDRRAVDAALHGLDAWGSTALHDAVVTAFDAIEPAPGRRALILISDGMEKQQPSIRGRGARARPGQ